MKENTSPLYSEYVIDGVQMQATPAQMLQKCTASSNESTADSCGTIIDETVDFRPSRFVFDDGSLTDYLSRVSRLAGEKRRFPIHFPRQFTISRIAKALIDTLWQTGHFRLEDLCLKAEWKWNGKPIGNMAAFYNSVEAACDYIDALGIQLKSYGYSASKESGVQFKAFRASAEIQDEEEDETDNPKAASKLGRKRQTPAQMIPDPSDWLIYIPFDCCEYRLGGSLLSEALDAGTSVAPDLGDADYFMDCYEVLRELVEDGIVKAGVTVGDGGLLTALDMMGNGETAAGIDIGDIRKTYGEDSPVRILFGEIPGAVIQINDIDYDYVDAELLLQDIAYFPIGHPSEGGLQIVTGDRTGISGILESLLNSSASEGED